MQNVQKESLKKKKKHNAIFQIFESILQDTRDLVHEITSGQDDKCPSTNLSKNVFLFSIFLPQRAASPLNRN